MLAGPALWPVVLFSPGNSLPRSIYTMIVQDLASHGFVVAAIDHPYSGAIVLLPGGRVAIDAGPEAPVVPFETRVGVRAADLRFVLDELGRIAGESPIRLRDRPSTSSARARVLLVTRSAAWPLCRHRPRTRAFVAIANLDGGTGEMADNLARRPTSPLMLITKSVIPGAIPTDQALKQWGSRARTTS
jgi:hypothetical protein